MALETLDNVKQIDGFTVEEPDTTPEIVKAGFNPIIIDREKNRITFQVQKGPIKENGVNGCQVDTIIESAVLIIKGLNEKFPCRENSIAITKLEEALMWLKKRKVDRETRSVEGMNKL